MNDPGWGSTAQIHTRWLDTVLNLLNWRVVPIRAIRMPPGNSISMNSNYLWGPHGGCDYVHKQLPIRCTLLWIVLWEDTFEWPLETLEWQLLSPNTGSANLVGCGFFFLFFFKGGVGRSRGRGGERILRFHAQSGAQHVARPPDPEILTRAKVERQTIVERCPWDVDFFLF